MHMSDTQDTKSGTDGSSDRSTQVGDAVASAANESAREQAVVITRNVVVTNEVSSRTLWKIVGVVIIVLVGFIMLQRAQNLVSMLIISMFFSLALVPLVVRLHQKR
jgi:hypothetical protein